MPTKFLHFAFEIRIWVLLHFHLLIWQRGGRRRKEDLTLSFCRIILPPNV